MADKGGGKWLDRYPITHPDHAHDLEQRAAELEFNDRLPRHEAEDRAYSEYKKETHYRGAAHHLRGLRAAQSSGDREDARKHDAMLSLHAKAAGFDPYQEVPAELHQYMHSEDPEPVHKFKAHRGDMLVLDDHKKSVEKSELQADLLRVLRKTELVLLLKGDVVPFPKDRIKPAVDQGKPAPVVRGPHTPFSGGTTPLYKPGHRVANAKGVPGTVQRVHPSPDGKQQHMYHITFDDGHSNTMVEDTVRPHKP